MRDAGGDRLDSGAFQQVDDLLGCKRRRHIDIGDGQSQQRIAYCAADGPGIAGAKRRGEPVEAGLISPGRVGKGHRAHLSRRERLTSIAAVAPQMR